MNEISIAEICHEANKVYCESIDDFSQDHWQYTGQWQKDSAIDGVKFHLENDTTPEDSHENWMKHKLAEGWRYGSDKDVERKLHPCLVPFNNLPEEQQFKDVLFHGIVNLFKKKPVCV